MGGFDNLIESLHPLERKVLPLLIKHNSLQELVKEGALKDVEVMRALQWLQNKGIIKLSEELREVVNLDQNGEEYLKKGLPEERFLKTLKTRLNLKEIQKITGLKTEELNISIGLLKRKSAIIVEKKGGSLFFSITEQGKLLLKKEFTESSFLKSKFPLNVKALTPEERFNYGELKKRKRIIKTAIIKTKYATLTELGEKLLREKLDFKDMIDQITPSILKDGSWRNKKFRIYDIKAQVPKSYYGSKHFESQAIDYIKRVWLDMGFKEMKGNLVQSAFWDLDCLYVPQDHPAREMQDTFYIKEPKYCKIDPKLVKVIKEVHENGGKTGSSGWKSPWNEEKAKRLLLRTHTTVLSAQTISKLTVKDLPAKFFSVGKVFRNEALDWKHLFEFYQVEGIVIDEKANLKHLKGYLKEFYKKMGFTDVRMRPAHFPYTEPSMEVDVFHPIKKEWIELGGSGIFRPEVVIPLLGKDIPVLAWGLGMPRIISNYFDIVDIRDINKNDIKQLREMKKWLK